METSVATLPSGASLAAQWVMKTPPASARDASPTPGLERSSGEAHGNPLQCSCLESPMDRRAWRATVHGVTKSPTRLGNWTTTKPPAACSPECLEMWLMWLRKWTNLISYLNWTVYLTRQSSFFVFLNIMWARENMSIRFHVHTVLNLWPTVWTP